MEDYLMPQRIILPPELIDPGTTLGLYDELGNQRILGKNENDTDYCSWQREC